ncbi:MAG: hypothetical protein V3T17_09825 [Pseudomonadales bacterium]
MYSGKPELAWEIWLPLAKQGHAPSQFQMARLIQDNPQYSQHLPKAKALLQMAAKSGYKPAERRLNNTIAKNNHLQFIAELSSRLNNNALTQQNTDPQSHTTWAGRSTRLQSNTPSQIIQREVQEALVDKSGQANFAAKTQQTMLQIGYVPDAGQKALQVHVFTNGELDTFSLVARWQRGFDKKTLDQVNIKFYYPVDTSRIHETAFSMPFLSPTEVPPGGFIPDVNEEISKKMGVTTYPSYIFSHQEKKYIFHDQKSLIISAGKRINQ